MGNGVGDGDLIYAGGAEFLKAIRKDSMSGEDGNLSDTFGF